MSIRRHKSGCYKVVIPVYDKGFYVAFNVKDAEELTKRSLGELDFRGCVSEFEDDPPVMVLREYTPSTVAHECMHLVIITLHRIGSFIDYGNQEQAAYLSGYIAEQTHKCWKMYKSRKGEKPSSETSRKLGI